MSSNPANRVSLAQWEVLTKFMEDHSQFALGHLEQTSNGRIKTRKLWEQVAVKCNEVEFGANKDAKKWAKTWADKKSALKAKMREEGSNSQYLDYEERMLRLMNITALDPSDTPKKTKQPDENEDSSSGKESESDDSTSYSPASPTGNRQNRTLGTKEKSKYYDRMCIIEERRLALDERRIAADEQRNEQFLRIVENIAQLTAAVTKQTNVLAHFLEKKDPS